MAHRHEPVVSPASASARPFSMPFAPGQVINEKYEVVDLVGVGGLGFVIAAVHLELGEKVALKFLRPEALANAEAVGRFAREARASAQIQSAHVARVFDVGTLPDGAPFIVMEYLEGSDLGALLQQRGALPVPVAVEYVLQTCEALAAAHARGVVHRDIKPDNLFLNRLARGVEVIKVLDFGISKLPLARSAFEARHPLVETTTAMGSPIYMSPEQIRASKSIDARTDIWSLGCVLYELLTNHLAFEAPSLTEVTALILESPSPSLRSTCPELPAELERIIQRCLAKQPDQRYQDVAELAVALAPFASPRGRIAIERCCTILQGAGLPRAGSGRPFPAAGATPPELPVLDSNMPAASTAALETPARTSRTPARRWPWSIAALIVTSSAAGLFVSDRLRVSDAANAGRPLATPQGAPAPAPSTDVRQPPPPEPTLTTASRVPREEALHPSATTSASISLPVAAAPPGAAALPEAAARPEAAAPPDAPPITPPPKPRPEGSPPLAVRPDALPPRAEVTKPKPVASPPPPPRRRSSAPALKPRPAPPSRPQQEEPDVGF
jgi:serine/threonine protein kinase